MVDLAQWLSAQLDHDEQVARDATAGPWRVAADEYARETDASIIESASVLSGDRPARVIGPGYEGGGVWWAADADHIVLHDPARVLRQVAAHRLILASYREVIASRKAHRGDIGLAGALLAMVGTLGQLASIYSDRPGYDPSWTEGT